MHDIRRLGLQVFAAPNNLTGEVQIEVKAREIDFVTSFGKNLKALLDILGITRMIRKENNSVLKTKTVKGELQSGDVGEGEEIPMSRYTVEEKPFDTIKIEKYRKGVSLEAISEKGYEAAVQDTDDEFKSDLQNVVTDKFYAQLKAGSLTGHETTWQMAVIVDIWTGRKRRRWLCNGYCRTAGSSSICICRHSEDRSLRGREESSSFLMCDIAQKGDKTI